VVSRCPRVSDVEISSSVPTYLVRGISSALVAGSSAERAFWEHHGRYSCPKMGVSIQF
jgi:hypothetical protein